MQVFNVEYYTRAFTLIGYTSISKIDFVYEEDYLSPVLNTITVEKNEAVEPLQYIRIYGDGEEYSGLIVDVEYDEHLMTVSYGTMLQQWFAKGDAVGYCGWAYGGFTNTQSIPKFMYDLLVANKDISNANLKANGLTGFSASYGAPANTYTFDKFVQNFETIENGGMLNVPLIISESFQDVLKKCMQHWDCLVWVKLDFVNKAVKLYIGSQSGQSQSSSQGKVIDITMSNLIRSNVTFQRTEHETTILSLQYGEAGTYEQQEINYYLHPNNTYDTTASNFVYPMSLRCEILEFDSSKGETAEAEAANVARGMFGNNTYTNLVEIECLRDDERIDPVGMEIGTIVKIFDGTQYVQSILTGKKIGTTCTLTFGVVRKDITKKLKLGGF